MPAHSFSSDIDGEHDIEENGGAQQPERGGYRKNWEAADGADGGGGGGLEGKRDMGKLWDMEKLQM